MIQKKKGHPKAGGRVKGTLNHATSEIRELVRKYCPAAVIELARLSTEAQSEQARVAAIKELLDRGYGKAPQPIDGDGEGSAIKLETKLIFSGVLAKSDENV